MRRWRCAAVFARRDASGSAGFRVDSSSGEVLRDGVGRAISLDPDNGRTKFLRPNGRQTPNFPEVPSHLLSTRSWNKSNG